jgi:hypothetical protein
MGSIQNLLNPMSNPSSPQRPSFSKRNGMAGEEPVEDAVVTLDSEAECYTPLELSMRPEEINNNVVDEKTSIDIPREKIQIDTQPSYLLESPESRSRTLHTNNRGDGQTFESKQVPELDKDESRRTSSSSLASILNPVEEEMVSIPKNVAKQSQPAQVTLGKTSEQMQTINSVSSETPTSEPNQLDTAPSYVLLNNDAVESEEIREMPDVVGVIEEQDGSEINVAEMKDAVLIEQTGHPMQKSESLDSQETILDPVDSNPIVEPSPSRPPSPSKKRKFSPESSPDEPLSNNVEVGTSITIEPDPESRIPLEKPQPAARAVKKPKKAPIKRPQAAKKKTASSGPKKPGRPAKRKEQFGTIDFDEVLRTRINVNNRIPECRQLDSPV